MAAGEGADRLVEQLGAQVNLGEGLPVGGRVQGPKQVEQGPGPAPGRQPGAIEILLHAQLLDQAQVLPEGADAGLLAAPGPARAGRWGPKPAQRPGAGLELAVGNGQQAAFAGATGPQQGHPFAAADGQ